MIEHAAQSVNAAKNGNNRYLNLSEVGELLNMTPRAVLYLKRNNDHLPFVKVDGTWSITRDGLLRGLGILPNGAEDDGSRVLEIDEAGRIMTLSYNTARRVAKTGEVTTFAFVQGKWLVMEGPLRSALGLHGLCDELLSVKEVAKIARCTARTIYNNMEKTGLTFNHIARKLVIPRSTVEKRFGLHGPSDRLITVAEAAEELIAGPKIVQNRVADGTIRGVKFLDKWLIPQSEIAKIKLEEAHKAEKRRAAR